MSERSTRRLTEADLRRVYQDAARDAGEHPDEATLGRLLDAALPASQREAALQHVAGCAECAAVLQHAARCGECAETFESRPVRPVAARVWPVWGGLAAAVLVAGIAIWPSLVLPPRPDPDALRAGSPAALAPIAPSGRIQAPPARFRWRGLPDAAAYRVVLFDARGEPVWTSAEVAEPTCPWPSKLPLEPGTYSWQVIATLRGAGSERVASPLTALDAPRGLAPVP
jgi:hypothetical protein